MARLQAHPGKALERQHQPPSILEPLPKTRYLLAAAAVGYLLLYIVIACLRMGYPYELEWMEGSCVDAVGRVLAGKPLYAQPSIDYVPYIYTPLYFYVSAAAAKVLGLGFLPLRLVSFLASLGCFALLLQFVRRETGNTFWGLIAAGLFAGCFDAADGWFDLARVDSLFLLLLLAAVYLVRFAEKLPALLLAGILMWLALLTKQSGAAVAGAMALYCLLARPRGSFLAYAGSLVVLAAAAVALLDGASDGWFQYYAFALPASHGLDGRFWIEFWTHDMARPVTVAMTLSLACILLPRQPDTHKTRLFYALLLSGMVATAWYSRLHVGGFPNVLLPAYLAFALCGAVGGHLLERSWRRSSTDSAAAEGSAQLNNPWLRWLYGICILQFALLFYLPQKHLPTQQDVRSGDELIRLIGSFDGEVLVADHGFYSALAGRPGFCHRVAFSDVLRGSDTQIRDRFAAELRDAVLAGRFAAIILDSPWGFPKDLERCYEYKGPVFREEDTFWTRSGHRTRPQTLYVRRNTPSP